jgi:beta-mannosidase
MKRMLRPFLTDWNAALTIFLLFLTIPAEVVRCQTPNATVDLDGAWLMKDFTIGIGVGKHVDLRENQPTDCFPAQVPGTVRTALLAAGAIPDPYYGYDDEKSLWVEEKEWWFFRTFSVETDLRGKWVDLVFDGTSFQGEVWLNGDSLGALKGMLNPHSFDVSKVLHYGSENYIAVRLEAPTDAREREIVRGLTWDSPRDQLYSIAQCMYSWDWGVHAVPVGIWRPVHLRVTGPVRIDHPSIVSKITSSNRASCSIAVDVHNHSDQPLKAHIAGYLVEAGSDKKAGEFGDDVALRSGESRTLRFDVTVRDAKLWWPNGMGDQNLYVLHTSVSDGETPSDQLDIRFGIRELKLVENEHVGEFLNSMKNDTGSIYLLGKVVGSYPWTFQVNGRKMFAKGANWVPADQLLRLDPGRYDRLLTLAKEAHFNLLRVWGGGLYETEEFYNLCDQYGILAWQEFLSNRSFSQIDKANFLDGAASAVYRLRNHPSLTFWCGGNEFDPDDEGSKSVIDSLDSMLKKLDPQREFHRASPYKGDDHYWGVWHGLQPYTKYRVVRPFRSEAGVSAFPVEEDFLKFTPPSFVWPPDTTYVQYHGEHNTRFEHLAKQMRYVDEFGAPTDISDLITKSQLYQALATSFNMEFCRSNKFRNSGLLVWQYDDIWPCASWSIVDWYGTPKAAYYFLKRASEPIHVSADFERYLWKAGETFAADIHLLNDTEEQVKGASYSVKLLDTRGGTLAHISGKAKVEANRSEKVGRIEYVIPAAMTGKTFFVVVELMARDGAKLSDAVYPIAASATGDVENYEDIFADMNAMAPASVKAVPPAGGLRLDETGKGTATIRLTNTGDRLAFFVRVNLTEESELLRTDYSDNYLSLLPGETKDVRVAIESKSPKSMPARLHFEVSGWRTPAQTIEMTAKQ